MKFVVVLTALFLAACTSEAEIAEMHARIAAYDDAQCRQLGFAPKTEAYGNCRLQLMAIRQQRGAAAAAAYGAVMQGQRNMIILNRPR